MKALLLMFLFLIPTVFAQDYLLEARKAQLDLRASAYIARMDTAIEFASKKNMSSALDTIHDEFEEKLQTALAATTAEDLHNKEKELREVAKKFKEEAKTAMKDVLEELKAELKKAEDKEKENISEKKNKADEVRKKALEIAFDKKIQELNKSIEAGKSSKVNKLLLKQFEKEKQEINATTFHAPAVKKSAGDAYEAASGAISIIGKMVDPVKNFFVGIFKQIEEEG